MQKKSADHADEHGFWEGKPDAKTHFSATPESGVEKMSDFTAKAFIRVDPRNPRRIPSESFRVKGGTPAGVAMTRGSPVPAFDYPSTLKSSITKIAP